MRAYEYITDEELLGVEACRAADALVAAAPPLTPQQRADLAVLLRRSGRACEAQKRAQDVPRWP